MSAAYQISKIENKSLPGAVSMPPLLQNNGRKCAQLKATASHISRNRALLTRQEKIWRTTKTCARLPASPDKATPHQLAPDGDRASYFRLPPIEPQYPRMKMPLSEQAPCSSVDSFCSPIEKSLPKPHRNQKLRTPNRQIDR